MNYNTIIWDWNGTLLNDVQHAVDCINIVLTKYKLRNITLEQYRSAFTFPIINYYKNIGFDFNKLSFDIVGKEFIDIYNDNINTCKLYNSAYETLSNLKSKGIKQIIISARFKPSLEDDLIRFKINQFIDEFYGIDTIYATSKEYLFEQFIKKNPNARILYVGDTTHDRDIAQKFNLKFLLFEQGHQSKKHFENSNHYTPIKDLSEILNYFS